MGRSGTPTDGDHGEAERRLPARKKPYTKPSFRHERVFETRALACGKINPTIFSCFFNRRNS